MNKMADIVLINPRTEKEKKYKKGSGFTAPLGLVSIGTYLEKRGYSVKVIDTMVENDYMNQIEKELKDAKLIGLSVMSAQIPHALEISKKLRKYKIPVIWGGIHPILFPEQTCKSEFVDYITFGEGEESVYRLMQFLN